MSTLLKTFFVFCLGGILFFGGTSCRSYDKKTDLHRLDTLQSMIGQASAMMIIDDKIIEQRADSINMKNSFITHNYKEKLNDQQRSDLVILLGIKSNYRSFLKAYPQEEYDNQEHAKRIDNLKKDLLAGRISSADFEKIYLKERPLIAGHLEDVTNNVKGIRVMENQYHRASQSINALYDNLKIKLGNKADLTIDKDEQEKD